MLSQFWNLFDDLKIFIFKFETSLVLAKKQYDCETLNFKVFVEFQAILLGDSH